MRTERGGDLSDQFGKEISNFRQRFEELLSHQDRSDKEYDVLRNEVVSFFIKKGITDPDDLTPILSMVFEDKKED